MAHVYRFEKNYLRASNTDNIVNEADLMLRSTFYTGEKRNFTFRKYVQMHKDVQTMLEDLTAAQYTGLDTWPKVKYLIYGINTFPLDTVKATIWESTTLRTYFESTANLFKTVITRQNTGLSGNNKFWEEYDTQHGGGGRDGRGYQGSFRGGGGGSGCGSFWGCGCGGDCGYQRRVHGGGGRGNPSCHINGINISYGYYTSNKSEQTRNEGRAKETSLRKARDENRNQAPASEPLSVQAAVITVEDANRIARDLAFASINT